MNVTLRLKLSCTPEAQTALRATISQFTEAFNRATKQAFAAKTTNGCSIHRMRYEQERSLTQLPSQLVCAMISKTAEALSSVRALQKKHDLRVRKEPKKFKPKQLKCPQSLRQTVRYDGKRASMVRLKEGWATLASITGRQTVRFSLPRNFNKYAEWKVCSSELVWDQKDRLFLHVVLDGEGKPFIPNGFVAGVDLGISRPAVMSTVDGKFNQFLGPKEWRAIEGRTSNYRRILQCKGTKPARRKLKLLSGKVNRFRKECDHILSRRIVDSVPTGSVIVFENLKDIRERCGKGKGRAQNGRMHRWSFDRLFEFVDYKATMAGIRVVKVDPRNTSRKCSKCGDVRKSNRQDQSHFVCHACHLTLNADLNGARNIAQKFASAGMPAEAGQSELAQCRLTLERQAPAFRRG